VRKHCKIFSENFNKGKKVAIRDIDILIGSRVYYKGILYVISGFSGNNSMTANRIELKSDSGRLFWISPRNSRVRIHPRDKYSLSL
jgi:hypothetical protein